MSAVIAIVVAGGSGERFARPGGKQLLEIAGVPMVVRTVSALASAPSVDEIVVVCHPQRVDEYRAAVESARVAAALRFVPGGETRQASVAAGLAAVADDAAIVAVHDGARPLVTAAAVERVLAPVLRGEADGAVLGYPVTDTLKLAEGPVVAGTPDRSSYWAAQTPQVFRAGVLREALAAAERDGVLGTDDSSLVERLGKRVLLVEGPRDNLKITCPEDAAIAEAILAWRAQTAGE